MGFHFFSCLDWKHLDTLCLLVAAGAICIRMSLCYVWTKMSSISCYSSSDLNISSADIVYCSNTEKNLWERNNTVPFCSSISPPLSSRCVVCLQKFIHTVCSDLPNNTMLTVEGDGKQIAITESGCPSFLNGTDPGLSHSPNLTQMWCLLLLPVVVAVVVYWKWKNIRGACQKLRREKSPKGTKDIVYSSAPDSATVYERCSEV